MNLSISAVSDLHGHWPIFRGTDILIIAGDLTATDRPEEHIDFWRKICYTPHKKRIVIAGNHDSYLEAFPDHLEDCGEEVIYLKDSGCEIDGLKIWGSPWTLSFAGMNPKCKAFTLDTEEELKEKWDLIPDDTDILITHTPPEGILDKESRNYLRCGSPSLLAALDRVKPRYHIFGHIHEGRGVYWRGKTTFINASYVGRNYRPHKEDMIETFEVKDERD